MANSTPAARERSQVRGRRRKSPVGRIFLPAAIIFFGGAAIAFLLVLSMRELVYPYLFGASAMFAFTAGFSVPVFPARPAWGANLFWIAAATFCFAGLLAASALLYVALDVDLLRKFCDPVSGNTGDVKLDGGYSCNYAYGEMAQYFLYFFIGAVAPFLEFVALYTVVLMVRRKIAALAEK